MDDGANKRRVRLKAGDVLTLPRKDGSSVTVRVVSVQGRSVVLAVDPAEATLSRIDVAR